MNETVESYDRIENDFTYHPPTPEKGELHEEVRTTFKSVAHYMDELLPNSREKALVLTKLEEALLWANAAIARNELPGV